MTPRKSEPSGSVGPAKSESPGGVVNIQINATAVEPSSGDQCGLQSPLATRKSSTPPKSPRTETGTPWYEDKEVTLRELNWANQVIAQQQTSLDAATVAQQAMQQQVAQQCNKSSRP